MTTIATNTSINQEEQAYNRKKEVEQFDETRLGVKGLVDSGIARIPLIFQQPPENLIANISLGSDSDSIPVIDLLGTPRGELVKLVRDASAEFGFFQVINHGVPVLVLDRLLEAIKAFHELPDEERRKHYKREKGSGVSYFSNVDLFLAKAANWRDTLEVRLAPTLPDPSAIPEVCREAIIEWNNELKQLGELLLGLFSEGLGASADRLKELSFLEGRLMVGHYYPQCPEPDKTIGIASHSDPGVFTVLLQDQVGGLQIKHGAQWVNVKPIPGALVINVGDLLQMVSNDKYTSVDHRVLANASQEPRVSIAVFFNPSIRENLYGPLPELVTPEEPAHYPQVTFSEFMRRFFTKELDGKSLINYFRSQNK